MKGGMDYWLGQLLSLIFYIMTLIVYNRARKEYVGGKIAAAINLIMVFLLILFVNDFVDYFLLTMVTVPPDVVTILKILLKLSAICVLFFGGLRFFVTQKGAADVGSEADFFDSVDTDPGSAETRPHSGPGATVALDISRQTKKPSLGRYEVLGQIGKGAMGIVYKGRDPKLNRLTAIKTIRFLDDYDEDKAEEIKVHFYREAELVAKLAHQNIVTIFDVGEDLDVSYLAMEFLEGESLDHYTSPGELLPVDSCIQIVIQVCDALDYAHRQGIIHRDIKPGNIMLLKNGLVKVTDFGIARAVGSTKTRTGIIKGTPFYMSPEQAKGKPLTGAADIFSLGVVFYQLLTGRLPFTGDNLAAIMYLAANSEPEPASTYNPKISRDVLKILDRALQKKPGDRFSSAKEMAQALRTLAGEPVEADSSPAAGLEKADGGPGIEQGRVYALEQISNKQVQPGDMVDFDDLDQELEEPVVSESELEKPFEDTEDLYESKRIYSRIRTAEEGAESERLDLSELREVLAERKRRLAQKDETAAKAVEEIEAAEGGLRDDRGWVPKKISDYFPETGKGRFRGFFAQGVYLAVILMALAGAYYYFWMSPNANQRALKLLVGKYFGSPAKTREMMLAEQERLVKQIMKEKLMEQQRLKKESAEIQVASEGATDKAAETQREQQRIIEEQYQEEKQKEQERLAAIEAEKRKDRERLARIEAEKRQEKERLAEIAEEKRKAKAVEEKREKEKLESLLLSELERIETEMAGVDVDREKGRYKEAKARLEGALQAIRNSLFQKDARLMQAREQIEKDLSADDIVYGSKGYVLFRNRWLSPQEYESELLREGYVRYNNTWKKYQTLQPTIIGKTKNLVNTFLYDKFKDERVHTTNIKFVELSLNKNSSLSSEYGVEYKWEVWTFKGMKEGICTIHVSYAVDKDKWFLTKGCE